MELYSSVQVAGLVTQHGVRGDDVVSSESTLRSTKYPPEQLLE
jgi:hypothetical protein